MHDDIAKERHFREDYPDYGLRSRYSHTPSSGYSYSGVDSYLDERSMNPNIRYVPDEPNRDIYNRWSDDQDFDFDLNRRMKDPDISDLVYNILLRHPEIDVSQIHIETRNRVVTLRGQVETRRMKRLIEDAIFGIPLIRDIQNRIEVLPRDPDRRRMARSLA